MKAIVYERYGPPEVLQFREVARPTPKEDEVLVKVVASSINSRDWRLMRANPFFIRFMLGLLKPKTPILGADLAGRVEAVGSAARQFKAGDEVFGYASGDDRGTFAEHVCVKENDVTWKPANRSFEQAAALPVAAHTALVGLRDRGRLQAGQKVLIQGASGGVGMFAVQIAKALGAEVTGVCSTRNLEMVRSLGAEHVIDYKKEDFTRNGQRYDLILAVNGYHPIDDYLRVLSPTGSYVVAGGAMRQLAQAALRRRRASGQGGQQIAVVSIKQNQQDLIFLKELLEAGKVLPVIDECYPLSKTAEAMRYFETVHPKGKVVIRMEPTNP